MRTLLLLRFLKPLAPLGWPLVRVALGALLVLHGWHRYESGVSSLASDLERMNVPVPQVAAWLSLIAEVLGGVLLVVGLFTRPAALFVAAKTAASLYFAHRSELSSLGKPEGLSAELHALMGVVALGLLVRGAGGLSLDGPDDSGQ